MLPSQHRREVLVTTLWQVGFLVMDQLNSQPATNSQDPAAGLRNI